MGHLNVKDFDLAATVRSGHLFAYDDLGKGKFRVINGNKSFVVEQKKSLLRYSGITEKELLFFFDLDLDVAALQRRLGKDRALRPLLVRYKEIRLVRQDVRQAILTFILSSNNNQKRIKGMVDRHRACVARSEMEYVRLGFGYRAPWIAAAEARLSPSFLATLRSLDYDDAKSLLLSLPGVGPKVADCVLAYSELARGEAFPADVWVKRALKRWYPSYFRDKPLTDKNIRLFAQKKFGDDAAYAQHYLFLAAQELLR